MELPEVDLCNGSQGIIIGFNSVTGLPIVRFNNGFEITINYYNWTSESIPGIGVSHIPLILAWAITIHKSQGTTLDMAQIDVGRGIFEAGQTYVALSRVKSLDGLYLTSFCVNKIIINRKVKEFYEKLTIASDTIEPITFDKFNYIE
jgi:ATP-dependent exoDNAse (exonuclease V), alpha subunit - helicase superfamily I member